MGIQTYFEQVLSELQQTLSQVSNEHSDELADAIVGVKRVFVAGAGRSGLVVRAFAMRLMHLGLTVHVVGETTTPSLQPDDLLIIGSGSGSTGSLVVMAEKAKKIGATLALLTIQTDSPIGQIADIIITIPAPSPKVQGETGFRSIQPMGALFEQSMALTLDTLLLLLMSKTNESSDTMFTRHANLE